MANCAPNARVHVQLQGRGGVWVLAPQTSNWADNETYSTLSPLPRCINRCLQRDYEGDFVMN